MTKKSNSPGTWRGDEDQGKGGDGCLTASPVRVLIDSHCHLDYLERNGLDLAEVVARAQAMGVGAMVTIGTKLSNSDEILAIAERFSNVVCSMGVHPHQVATESDVTTARLVELAQHPKVVGIGESGLDYYYEHSPREVQKKSFQIHIDAARETGLPLIVHTREADKDTMDILQNAYQEAPYKGLIHCFSSGSEVSERALEIGFSISISGIMTFKKSEALRAVIKQIPLDRLLVETDAPFLAPMPKRGRPNEPAYTRYTAQALAGLKGISEDRLAMATTENFFTLFDKVPKDIVTSNNSAQSGEGAFG